MIINLYQQQKKSNLKCKFVFLEKSQFMRSSDGKKEKLPIKIDEESSLVAEASEISNLRLVEDICKILAFIDDEVSNKTRYCSL